MNEIDNILGNEIDKINIEERESENGYDDWEEEYMREAYLEDYKNEEEL